MDETALQVKFLIIGVLIILLLSIAFLPSGFVAPTGLIFVGAFTLIYKMNK